MLLPIINNRPKVILEELENYKDILSKPQFFHFSNYVIGLILEDKQFTINSISSLFEDAKDQSSLNRFFLSPAWDEEELTLARLRRLDQSPKTRTKQEGYIILDDTLCPKTGRSMEGADYYWSTQENKAVFSHSVVSTHYVDEKKEYPLLPGLYLKKGLVSKEEFRTKIQIGIELVEKIVRCGHVRAKTLLIDAWYLAKSLINTAKRLGLDWISRLKTNRKVIQPEGTIDIGSFIKTTRSEDFLTSTQGIDGKTYFSKSFELEISKIGKVKVVLVTLDPHNPDEEVVPLVTNRLDWDDARIINGYLHRHRIDAFYRDAKQSLGLGGYRVRHVNGVVRHLHLVFFAHSLLETLRLKGSLIKWLRDKMATIGQLCKAVKDLFNHHIVKWLYQQFRSKIPLYKVLAMLGV